EPRISGGLLVANPLQQALNLCLLTCVQGQQRRSRPPAIVAIEIASVLDPRNAQGACDALAGACDPLLLLGGKRRVVILPRLVDLLAGLRRARRKAQYCAARARFERLQQSARRSRQHLESNFLGARLDLLCGRRNGDCRSPAKLGCGYEARG